MKKDTLNLNKRDLELIYADAKYKFLSSFHLIGLYFPDSIHENATRRLTALTNHGFLSRVFSYPKATDDHKGGHPTAVYFWTPENKKRLQEYLERASDSLRKKWTCDLPMNRAVSRRHVS